MEPIVIIGAGLTGLTTAYLLRQAGQSVRLLEGRHRNGGRIFTSGTAAVPLEMGATWFGPQHTLLRALLQELNLAIFQQHSAGTALFDTFSFAAPQPFHVAQAQEPIYRIAGGTAALIERLVAGSGPAQIDYSWVAAELIDREDYVLIVDQQGREVRARRVISTIPPAVLGQQVHFTPALPPEAAQVLQSTHTWMSGSTKAAVSYGTPFWRQRGFSGAVFSQVGPISELHDHTNAAGTGFGLMGFLAAGVAHLPPAERQRLVVDHLVRLFGEEAAAYTHYEDYHWGDEFVQTATPGMLVPHQNNGHPRYGQALFGGKLWLAGTETAPHYGGYMEGAIWSARAVSEAMENLPSPVWSRSREN